jgi:GST-like protein
MARRAKGAVKSARRTGSAAKPKRHYTLYGCKRCGSMLVEAALEEIGAPYDLVDMEYNGPQHRSAEYRRLNPLERVPALVLPDGTVMTESAAILIALADRHPRAKLMPPASSPERATLLRWLLFLSNNLYEAIGRQDYPERYVPDRAAAPGVRARAVEDLKRFWTMLEEHLKPAPFALGRRFSALDLYIANLSQWTVKDWLYANCPRVKRLVELTAKRPRVRPVWQRHFPVEKAAAE